MNKQTHILRMGTRATPLALTQAHKARLLLEELGYEVEIVNIKSQGDKQTKQPLYEMGIVGVFTRALDEALSHRKIDLAVHSLKDVPTALHKDVVYGAFLPRESSEDVLIYKNPFKENEKLTLATSSLRRAAFWLNRYPHHKIENLRGNILLRLDKVCQSKKWNGTILAQAGLDRLNIKPHLMNMGLKLKKINWMIPAPAQGCIVIVTHKDNAYVQSILAKINDPKTEKETYIERQFLKRLEGGCTAPIGAHAAFLNAKEGFFKGALLSEDGSKKIDLSEPFQTADYENIGNLMGEKVMKQGGTLILKTLTHR